MDDRNREGQFNVRLGEKIRSRRREAGLVQAQLAQMSGLSRASVTNIEAGTQAPPPFRLALIADALRVQVTDLVPTLAEIGAPTLPDGFAAALPGSRRRLTSRRERECPVARADVAARQLLDSIGWTDPPVDPARIAADVLGVVIAEVSMPPDMSGMLVREPERVVIGVNEDHSLPASASRSPTNWVTSICTRDARRSSTQMCE